MPFLDISSDSRLPSFYNVISAVGTQCPNQPNEVKLVQMMLQIIYDAPAGELKPDGMCGPKTQKWIRQFQSDMRRSGTPTSTDGRIDRARNQQGFGSISQTRYCIISLNEVAQACNPAAWFAIRSSLFM